MNEYQNYKIGSSTSSKSSKRPSSVSGPSSRLLKSTQAVKGKNVNDPGNYPFGIDESEFDNES